MMFIFTNPTSSYPGLSTQVGSLPTTKDPNGNLPTTLAKYYGSVSIQNVLSGTALTGVLPGATGGSAPATLNQYSGVMMWQDRGNSTVVYDSTGHVTSQSNSNTLVTSGSNGMNIFGLIGGTNVNGVIYQPEGAYLTNAGAVAALNVSTQIITGAIYVNGAFLVDVTIGNSTHLLNAYSPGLIQ